MTFIYPYDYGLVIYLLYATILLGVPRKFFDYTIKLQNGAVDPLVYRCLS
jgi:sRNA-binding regulator protein Hfq